MYKRDDKSRAIALFGLVLLVLGLGVMLVTSKITNAKVLAVSEEVMQDALKNIDENERELLEHSIYSTEIEKGYKLVTLNNLKKEEINSKILDYDKLDLLVQAKDYEDEYGFTVFNNGIFTDTEMLNVILSTNKNLDINETARIIDLSKNIFNKSIDNEKLTYILEDESYLLIDNIYDRIFKVNKIYKNYENSYYDIFIDEIYPNNPDLYDEYVKSSFTDYSEDEIINTYKISIDNNYKFISLDCYNF